MEVQTHPGIMEVTVALPQEDRPQSTLIYTLFLLGIFASILIHPITELFA